MKKLLLVSILPSLLYTILLAICDLNVLNHPIKTSALIITFWMFPLYFDWANRIDTHKSEESEESEIETARRLVGAFILLFLLASPVLADESFHIQVQARDNKDQKVTYTETKDCPYPSTRIHIEGQMGYIVKQDERCEECK